MRYSKFIKVLAIPALAGMAACSKYDASLSGSSSASLQHVQLSLSGTAAPVAAALAQNILYDMDGGGRIKLSMVDSLIVHVSEVDVLPDSLLRQCFPVRGDSTHGFHPMDPDDSSEAARDSMSHRPAECRGGDMGPMGPGFGGGFGGGQFGRPHFDPDSLRPDSGFGHKASDWFALKVVGDGHLDLVHLPTDSVHALVLASDSVPPGNYGAARLFLKDATIYLDTTITLTAEDSAQVTFKADTGYAVKFPRMAQRFGFVTNAGFTVPNGGGNVDLIFDAGTTLAGIRVNDDGQIVVRPLVSPRHPED